MAKYNLDKLIKVECKDFVESQWYKYKKELKFLFIVIRKGGIYCSYNYEYFGFMPIENCTFKDYKVYENPKVILWYQSDHAKVYYFKSFDEAKKFADEITSVGRWIE